MVLEPTVCLWVKAVTPKSHIQHFIIRKNGKVRLLSTCRQFSKVVGNFGAFGHRWRWNSWVDFFFFEVRLGWRVGAAFTSWIKRAFIVVFLQKWPPACDAIRRRRSFASALWWKLFFSQQAVINLNCQTCALKFGAIWRERGGQRGPGWIASLVVWCRPFVKLLRWINGGK